MTLRSEDLERSIRAFVDLRERGEISKDGLIDAIIILIKSDVLRLIALGADDD